MMTALRKTPDTFRPLARKWTLTLFFGTCLLYCARMAMPICAVSMATTFHWTKIESGLVMGGFLWGYCLTQILGGYISDKYVTLFSMETSHVPV